MEDAGSESSVVCTLFEGDYHFGLGALVNSLYQHGFRGVVWAGYRGQLPRWAQPLVETDGYREYCVAAGCLIRFLPVDATCHFAAHKPGFMLDLWNHRCPDARALFYFDPDIAIKCAWAFFEEWAACGVAVCEDMNSPMPASHPIRHAWRRLCRERNVDLAQAMEAYVNSGFIGVERGQREFLRLWQEMIAAIESEVGRLDSFLVAQRPSPFYSADQDGLNMALTQERFPISLIGKEGMDFIPGGYTMSHAAGGVKPWRKRMLFSALQGCPPSLADKAYLQNANFPIPVHTPLHLRLKRLDARLGAAAGRFIRRA